LNTAKFLQFGFAVLVVFVPAFIWSLIYGDVSLLVSLGFFLYILLAGVVGYMLHHKAAGRWAQYVKK